MRAAENETAPPDDSAGGLPTVSGATPGGIIVTTAAERVAAAESTAKKSLAVPARTDVTVLLPRVTRKIGAPNFNLSKVADNTFEAIGQAVASAHTARLDRKILDVVDVGNGIFKLAPRQGQDIDATVVSLPLGGITDALVDAILALDFVNDDQASVNAAKRLVSAAVKGAGGEDKLEAYHEAAMKLVQRTLRTAFKTSSPIETEEPSAEPFAPGRLTHREREPNRFGGFSTEVAYEGWMRSLHGYNWFDSEPERRLANLLDADRNNDGVIVWARICSGDINIAWRGLQNYNPDFYVCVGREHLLLEMKRDSEVGAADVQAKKVAAQDLARELSDIGKYGSWRYLLVSEANVKVHQTVADLFAAAAGN